LEPASSVTDQDPLQRLSTEVRAAGGGATETRISDQEPRELSSAPGAIFNPEHRLYSTPNAFG